MRRVRGADCFAGVAAQTCTQRRQRDRVGGRDVAKFDARLEILFDRLEAQGSAARPPWGPCARTRSKTACFSAVAARCTGPNDRIPNARGDRRGNWAPAARFLATERSRSF